MKKLMIALVLGLSILFSSTVVKAELEWEHIQFIWEWTKKQMEYKEEEGVCPIAIVGRDEIRKNYIMRSCELLANLVDEHGVIEGAKRYFEHVGYVRAFFDREVVEIYITDLQDDCEEASILAHELTHYIQFLTNMMGDDPFTHTNNELEAEGIEAYYYKVFCEERDENLR